MDTDCFSRAPDVRVFQADVSDHYLVHIAMHCRARHTALAPRLARHGYHVMKLQDLHVREAYSAHIASQLRLFNEKMQQL